QRWCLDARRCCSCAFRFFSPCGWVGPLDSFSAITSSALLSTYSDRLVGGLLLEAQQRRLVGAGQRRGGGAILAVFVRNGVDQLAPVGAGGEEAALKSVASQGVGRIDIT